MEDNKRTKRIVEQFSDQAARLFPELHNRQEDDSIKTMARSVTFQVTDDCNLACKYCYQINKGQRGMSLETAKKFVDMLLDADESNTYINPVISPFIILDFIGGEPLLEIDLIDQIVDYFNEQTFQRRHPWAGRYMVSICSNGTLYNNPNVQRFLNKNRNHVSFSITIDGNKELHDSCRIFHDGSPSYDLAVAAAKDWMDRGYYMGSKITIAPENITFLFEALKHMVELGYKDINANCVYEEGWTLEHAQELYKQMRLVSDYLIDNHLDDVYLSLFEENFFKPKPPHENDNWCFAKGTPVLTTCGYKSIEDINVGDMLYTEDGTVHPVVDVKSHFADNVVKMHLSGVFDIMCTDNHKFFTKPFDYIGFKDIKKYKDYGLVELRNIKHKDLIPLFRLPERNISFDRNIAYLVGRYIGDGWDQRSHRVHNICCSHDAKLELESKFVCAGIDYQCVKNKTVYQFSITRNTMNIKNDELHDILSECGHLAHGKRVPSECLKWKDESLMALLNGYFDADGHRSSDGKCCFNTVSYELAQDMMLILRTLGYTPTCHHNERDGKSKICNRDVNVRDRYEVYFFDNPSRSKYVHIHDDKLWSYGIKTTPAEPQTVYNLTVDTNHSYIAGGIPVSNCGGLGSMLACDPDGYLYPCIRYMESSLGNDQPPLRIGHVDTGLLSTDDEKTILNCMTCVSRRSQSTDECFYCPVGEGCSWCSALNYQVFGTVNKRTTYICEMHKARSLANVYYWNKFYIENEYDKQFKMYCPEEMAVEIIGKDEYDYLLNLAGGAINED